MAVLYSTCRSLVIGPLLGVFAQLQLKAFGAEDVPLWLREGRPVQPVQLS